MSPHSFIQSSLEHLATLQRVGRRLTGSRADADDLVQATMERALARREELRDPARLKGWLLAIQRTVFLNSRRSLRSSLEVLEGGLGKERPLEPQGDLQEELEARSLRPELRDALDALAPEWRDALWLREVEELTYEEIADVQGCPIGTVRSRIARARQAMLTRLTKERVHGIL